MNNNCFYSYSHATATTCSSYAASSSIRHMTLLAAAQLQQAGTYLLLHLQHAPAKLLLLCAGTRCLYQVASSCYCMMLQQLGAACTTLQAQASSTHHEQHVPLATGHTTLQVVGPGTTFLHQVALLLLLLVATLVLPLVVLARHITTARC